MNPKNTSIQNFFERFANYASQARGTFTIYEPPFMKNPPYLDFFSKDLETGIAATGFTIPTQQLTTYAPFSYNGPTIDIPHTQIFTDLEVQFILSGKTADTAAKIYQTFSKWQEYIAGYTPRKKEDVSEYGLNPIPSSISGTSAFSTAYYDNYVTNAIITVDSPNDNNIIRVEYSECYPKSIGSLQTSWDSPDTPLLLSVTFGYYYARVY